MNGRGRPLRESSKKFLKNIQNISSDNLGDEVGDEGSGVDSIEELLDGSDTDDDVKPKPSVSKPSASKLTVKSKNKSTISIPMMHMQEAISSKSSSSNLTVKNENGSTISIPVLHIPEESDDSDIEVVETVVKIPCEYCNKYASVSFSSQHEYHDHLSTTHFFSQLMERFRKTKISADGRQPCPFPKCSKRFILKSNGRRAVSHLGVEHDEITRLVEERKLIDTQKRRKSNATNSSVAGSSGGGKMKPKMIEIQGKTLTEVVKIKEEMDARNETESAAAMDVDDVIVVEQQDCGFCSSKFESKQDLAIHLVKAHITPRMEKELEECGWEAGEEVCPECQNSETEMAQHWGLCHGGVDRAIKKYQGHKEAFVKMKGAQGEMCKWSRAKLRKVRIDIKVTDFLTEAAKVIIQEKKSEAESLEASIGLAMEVESEEVDCYPSPFVFNSSQPILKGLDSQAIQPEIDSQLTQPEQESQPSDDDEDNIETVDLEKVEKTSNEKTEDWEPSEKAEDNVEKKEIETKEEKVEMRKFTIGVLVDETEESDKDDSSDEIGHDTSDKPGTDANTLDANKSVEATHNQDAEPTPNVAQPTGLEVSNKREDSPASRDPRRLGRKSTEPNSVKIKTEDMAGSSNVIPSPFVGAALPPPNLDKDTTDDDEIEVIYHLQPEKDQQDRKPPVSETKGLGFDLGNIVQDFISGNVPKSRRLDKIEKNLDLGASGSARVGRVRDSVTPRREVEGEIKILSEKHRTPSPAQLPKETCLICSETFMTLNDFYIHLARTHFKANLQKRLYADQSSFSAGEWRCPSCKLFVSADLEVIVDHYGAICFPHPVKNMYNEHNMKSKESKPNLSCVFCDDTVEPKDLVQHVTQEHIEEVKFSMGLVWSFLVSESVDICCPICHRVDTTIAAQVHHFIKEHTNEFVESLEKYRQALKDGGMYECFFCSVSFSTVPECIQHLILNHFKENLLSESGLTQDEDYACSNCIYSGRSQDEIVYHYGTEHLRLNFFFTERLLNLVKTDDVILNKPISVKKLKPEDYHELAFCLDKGAGLIEELTAREFLKNANSKVYNKCRNLIQRTPEGEFKCFVCDFKLTSESMMMSHLALRPHQFAKCYATLFAVQEFRLLWCKICQKQCKNQADFTMHLGTCHFNDNLLLDAGVKVHNLPIDDRRYFCLDCPKLGQMGKKSIVLHRSKEHPQNTLNLYKRTQITSNTLMCKMCQGPSGRGQSFPSLAALKSHLGFHFPQEIKSCLREAKGSIYCVLCDLRLYEVGGNPDVAVGHVAERHNYLETLFFDQIENKVQHARPSREFRCELCDFSTTVMSAFLQHITSQHVLAVLDDDLHGLNQVDCNQCRQVFSYQTFIDHAGFGDSDCNISMGIYFRLVDEQKNGPSLDYIELTFSQCLQRIRALSLAARPLQRKLPDTYPSKYIHPETPDFVEDPVSAEIILDLSTYDSIVTVEFKNKLPMKSFKSSSMYENIDDKFSCELCPIFSGSWDAPEGAGKAAIIDAFTIHLANTHFKTELERMFGSSSSAGDYECCRDSFNFQTLVGHIKENHSTIINMYKAVVPVQFPSFKLNNINKKVMDTQFVSHLMPWLPNYSKEFKKAEKSVGGLNCKCCNNRISGSKKELNKHYIYAHFLAELDIKFKDVISSLPYKCPEKGCIFMSGQKEEFYMHLANKHRVIEVMVMGYSQMKPALKFIKPEVSIKHEVEEIKARPTASYLHPQPFQCLTCHEDKGDLLNLFHHMRQDKHVNHSWAIQSNFPSGKASSSVGIWYQKLDVNFRCSVCVKKAAGVCIYNFTSVDEVFVHICTIHRDYFLEHYPASVASFSLCKVCDGFINLAGHENEEDRKQAEYKHYMLHGPVLLIHLGILRVKNPNQGLNMCTLCNKLFKSWENFSLHLENSHRAQVLTAYRDFNLPKSSPPDICCICKQSDTCLVHLSSHNKQILVKMGLIQANAKDHKAARIMCRVCNFTDKNCLKILEHFDRVHSSLFDFLRVEYDKQNEALDIETAVPVNFDIVQRRFDDPKPAITKPQQSLLKNSMMGDTKFQYYCQICSAAWGMDLVKYTKHLTKHCYNEILEKVSETSKMSNKCPDCGVMDETIDLHYWIQHIVSKGLAVVKEPELDGTQLKCQLCGARSKERDQYYAHFFWIHCEQRVREEVKKTVELKQADKPFTFCPVKGCTRTMDSEKETVHHCAMNHGYLEKHMKLTNRMTELDRVNIENIPKPKVEVHSKSKLDEKTGDEWKTADVCPICKKSVVKYNTFERTNHFLDHFMSDFKTKTTHINKNRCDACNLSFSDDKNCYMHFGTDHGWFDRFIDDHKKLAKVGFMSEFSRFIQQKTSPKAKKAHVGEQCKICDKVFETYTSAGVLRKPKDVSKERLNHYISHYRVHLLAKFKECFTKKTPLKCCKCSYYTVVKSSQVQMHSDALLIHLAECQGELENLIALAKPRQTSSSLPAIKVLPKIKQIPKRTEWNEVDFCVICNDAPKKRSKKDQKTHYTRHFKDNLEVIFSSLLEKSNLDIMIACPVLSCQVQIERDPSLSEEDLLVQFFQHIGFTHGIIPKLFLAENKVKINDTDPSEIIIDCNKFWAIKKGNCLVCSENLSCKSVQDRVKHYNGHFKTFSPVGKCYKCSETLDDSASYRLHILNNHLNEKFKENIKFKVDEEFKCAHCQVSSKNIITLMNHVINEELFLDVEIMADMHTKNVVAARKPDIVTIHDENEVPDLKECLLCNKFIKGANNFFNRHIYKVHYDKEIKLKIDKYFNSKDQLDISKCKSCGESVPFRLLGAHVGDHENIHKLYLSHIKKSEKVEEVNKESNELTTLGEDADDIERAEREFKNFLRSMNKSKECFTQNAPCYRFGNSLPPCHECKKIQQGANYALSGTCCCFEGFRKIRYIENGRIIIVGYLDPSKDPKSNDVDIWVPKSVLNVGDLSEEEAFLILKKVGDLLCDIIEDEKQMKEKFQSNSRSVVWKRLHQGVREMCDVCSTTIYNLHFTCSRCGVLVCCDCFLARMKGTKYMSINAVTKPTRTRKRFRSGLDMNLWPLCLNNQIHDIDKLVMTQMSPDTATEDLLVNIHSIKSFYALDCDCKTCTSTQDSLKYKGLDTETSVKVFQICPECCASFEDISEPCKQIHLAQHIKDAILAEEGIPFCNDCNLNTGSANNYLVHKALVHNIVENHYGHIHMVQENSRQEEVVLEVDSHKTCKVCLNIFYGLDKNKKRMHYLQHLSEHMLENIKAVPPYSCEECDHVEFDRQRLLLHMGFFHKKLDSSLKDYMLGDSNTSMKRLDSWEDIQNCIVCNAKMDLLSLSNKRNHYIQHFRSELAKMVNDKYDNIIERGAPYRCRLQGCKYIVEAGQNKGNDKARFLHHMGGTHRMIDTFMVSMTKTMIQTQPAETNADMFEVFSGKCQICEEVLDSSDSPDAMKAAKNHYHIHFKNHIEDMYEDVLAEHKAPLSCPYEGCQFTTEDVDSDQFGHHKKKLIKHMGSFHELFKKFVTQGTSSKKNYEMSEKFESQKVCQICLKNIEGDEDNKTHYYQHFKNEIEKEYEREIFGDSDSLLLCCPFCDRTTTNSKKEVAFKDIAIHIGVDHGVFDNKIEDYTRNLDYNKESSCRICGKDFARALAKATALKKHYAEHFAFAIEEEYPDLSGACPICSQKISKEALIIHIGTSHGYFCRLIEKHHWKEEEDWMVEESLKDVEEAQNENSLSKCIICGVIVSVEISDTVASNLEKMQKIHLLQHISHLMPGENENLGNVCEELDTKKHDKLLKDLYGKRNVENIGDFFVLKDSKLISIPCLDGASKIESHSLRFKEKDPLHQRLQKCYVCNIDFTSVDNIAVKLHLMRHFSEQLVDKLMSHEKLQCPSCPLTMQNKLSLLAHFSIAHNMVDKILEQELDVKDVPDCAQERTDSGQINRYTLPKNGERYKSICLICGSDNVRLPSVSRLKGTGEKGFNIDFGLHLVKYHFKEFFDFLDDPSKKKCEYCKKTEDSNLILLEHIVSEHSEIILNVLSKTMFCMEESPAQISYSSFFSGYGFFDIVPLNVSSLESIVVKPEILKQDAMIPTLPPDKVEVSQPAISDHTKASTQDRNYGKRKSEMMGGYVKKLKPNAEELHSVFEKSVQCDICNSHISSKKHSEHVFLHVEEDLRSSLKINETKCSFCSKQCPSFDALVKHIALEHNYAMSIYKKLDSNQLTKKKRQFYDQLSKTVPRQCNICGVLFDKRFEACGKHLAKEHSHLLKTLDILGCQSCNIKITGINSDYYTLAHHLIEHPKTNSFDKMIAEVIAKDWKLIGLQSCELCSEEQLFDFPFLKRNHLVHHFRESLNKTLIPENGKFRCSEQGCEFKTSSLSTGAQHMGTVHKAVDKLLPIELLKEPNTEGPLSAKMCVICSFPINEKEVQKHIISHFFTSSIVPMLSLTKCPVENCLGEVSTNTGFVYGDVLQHFADNHESSDTVDFLKNPDIKDMIGSPVKYFQLQCGLDAIMKGYVCIFCFEPIPGNAIDHIKHHILVTLGPTQEDEEDYECQLCDGYPVFNSLGEIQKHNMDEHCNVVSELKSLGSIQSLYAKRKRMNLISSTKKINGPVALLEKVKLKATGIPDKSAKLECPFDGCSRYSSSEFYSHFANHFMELLLRDLVGERASIQQPGSPLSCPRCQFSSRSLDQLLNHFGEYHRIIDFYFTQARDSMVSKPAPLELKPGASCGICGRRREGRRKPTEKVEGPPLRSTQVCAECVHEAGLRIDHIRRVAQFHPQVLSSSELSASYTATQTQSKTLVKTKSNNPLSLALLGLLDTDTEDEPTDNNPPRLRTLVDEAAVAEKKTAVKEKGSHDKMLVAEPGLTTLAPRHILANQQSEQITAEAQHSWLCDGRLLHLYDAVSPHNNELFKEQWARGQPVIISNSDRYLDRRLWHPKAFMRDFEDYSADLVNTLTGRTVPKQPLKWFWEGFSSVTKRLVDAEGTPMLLKLKDWPPDGDIAESLPKRYHNLVHDFPIPSYTLREGKLNLASYMPDYYLKPELGPKMYIAYGNALYSERASTNLHLDMSDAVNLLVYVGLPDDCDPRENMKVVLEQVDEAGCDLIMRRRVREEGLLPGAIWHIFHPGDTNKIRDLLIKVAIEKGKRLDPHDDPIHDQSTYLDTKLRMRLFLEYGVKSYAIIQCAGDTVFIPAGATHQVRNLHNCIKIAEDFVSPELANNCLHLTQEFRHLTEHHTNHEDKLQIKNIIYHSVKSAVARLNLKMKQDLSTNQQK